MGQKLVVLFPGIGYNCDKPLLHYARRIFSEAGYEVVMLSYSRNTFAEGKVTEEGVEQAYQNCRKQLEGYCLTDYDDVVFVGKSVGTLLSFMIGADYEKKYNNLSVVRYIALTPLAQTFPYMQNKTVLAASGTQDPIIAVKNLRELAERYGVTLHLYKGANHSLEVRNHPECSVEILAKLVELIKNFTK